MISQMIQSTFGAELDEILQAAENEGLPKTGDG